MSEVKPGSAQEHPGLELGRYLKEHNIQDSTVADQGGLSRPLISQITNGNRRITSSSAMKICKIIGGDPMYWVRRQQEHDLYEKGRGLAEATSNSPASVGSR